MPQRTLEPLAGSPIFCALVEINKRLKRKKNRDERRNLKAQFVGKKLDVYLKIEANYNNT